MDINKVKFNREGLIPCIAQDADDGRVLMLAYMNSESLRKTVREGKACYFSRSRKKLWIKGEESGNVQEVREIYFDCDADAILLKVRQRGGCACHKGYRSCFFRKLDKGELNIIEKKVKDPGEMYKKQK